MHTYAEQWKNATTTAEQENIFKAHGTRWSELWRLPYWDPSCQLIVDSMHCIFEGLIQHHFRDVLSLLPGEPKSRTGVIPAFTYKFIEPDSTANLKPHEIDQVYKIYELLTAPIEGDYSRLVKALSSNNLTSLKFVVSQLNCVPTTGKKAVWVNALVNWVSLLSSKPYDVVDVVI